MRSKGYAIALSVPVGTGAIKASYAKVKDMEGAISISRLFIQFSHATLHSDLPTCPSPAGIQV